MRTGRFTEKTELNFVYQNYVVAYQQKLPGFKHWPLMGEYRLIRAMDDAAVSYTSETCLFDGKHKLAEQSDVARSLSQRMLDAAAYFLAQQLKVEEVPETLRISMAICHNNTHWTGAEVTIPAFKKVYVALLRYCKERHIAHEDFARFPMTSRLNAARNIIYDYLGLVLEKPKKGEKKATDSEKILAITSFFCQGQPLQVKHYDSLNSDGYHSRVLAGLHLIKDFVKFKPVRCSQQKGNTCGDHATINLFMSSVMLVVPAINEGRNPNLTSTDLRKFTDSVRDDAWNIKGAREVIDRLTSRRAGETISANEQVYEQDRHVAAIAAKVTKLIKDLESTGCKDTANIVRQAVMAPSKESKRQRSKLGYNMLDAKQLTIVADLEAMFSGNDAIFSEMKLPEEDKTAYGVFAGMIANDYCEELERGKIKNADVASKKERTGLFGRRDKSKVNAREASITPFNPSLGITVNAAPKKLDVMETHYASKLSEYLGNIKKKLQNFTDDHAELIAAVDALSGDTDEIKRIASAAKEQPGRFSEENVKRIVLLYQFKKQKLDAIDIAKLDDPLEGALYRGNLNRFHNEAIRTVLGFDSPEVQKLLLRESATKEFKHLHVGQRIFADVMLVISSLFLVGFGIGIYRVAKGQTWFFSGNSSVKQLEKQVFAKLGKDG